MLPWQEYAEQVMQPLVDEGVYACLPCDTLQDTQVSKGVIKRHIHTYVYVRVFVCSP